MSDDKYKIKVSSISDLVLVVTGKHPKQLAYRAERIARGENPDVIDFEAMVREEAAREAQEPGNEQSSDE